MAKCIRCRQGFNWECETGNCDSTDNNVGTDSLISSDDSSESEESGTTRKVRTHDDAALRDPQSTGRKRAAIEYPLFPEKDCEWKMKKDVGGGRKPIVGCVNGKQQARHHGPDKNTLNNDQGNVHRICHNCHNRWHTENDEGYDWGTLQSEHDPKPASIEEIAANEMYWATRQVVKAKD